ncbi:uncharacterized protein LOC133178241 [Saccostrea echinata]|uniref:uncharacterized protein LOC133178241 n=1 Tax=Saccostrea echinata TaxID=191078 RepID=UPI002A81B691|nr:uncharacterized protein LOC133178241 [Saccostrea echinata]
MQCVWFLFLTFLLGTSITDASEKKGTIKFGNGKYDIKDKCWETKPTIPKLKVSSGYQSLEIRRRILRALKCRSGIKKLIDQNSCDCEPRKVSNIGLKNICPHEFEYVTTIYKNKKRCYVVHPHKQCVTYAKCKKKEGCSKNASMKSACLPDRHRIFNVWVFCPDNYRFELETLELPQCCTCREYWDCEDDS